MWRALYTLPWMLLLPALLLRLRLRGRREPGYGDDLRGRLGTTAPMAPGAIWVHAVSAGEVNAAAPLIRALRARHPERPLLVTVTTATGRARARELFAAAPSEADGAMVETRVAWLPFDLPACVDRFVDAVRPVLLVIVETELWPGLIDACARRAVPVALVNARLSARSARGYGRVAPLTRAMLARLALIACQDAATAGRFRTLGAAADRVRITGTMKFDLEVPADLDARIAALRGEGLAGAAATIVAGSTHDDEEARLVDVFAPLLHARPGARLVLVPRHPPRFAAAWEAVRDRCADHGLHAARAGDGAVAAGSQVLLVDRMGVLLALYGLADVAIVGGSLIPRGGHNPIEPAWHGVPVLIGPHGFNFEAVNAAFRDAGALFELADETALAARAGALLDDDLARARAGSSAREVVMSGRGALGRTLDALASLPLARVGVDER